MSTTNPATAKSLACRYCRAENFETSSQCWLCDARDWKPTATTPKTPRLAITAADIPPAGINPRAMVAALASTCLIVGLGLGSDYFGLAITVSVVWWLSIGLTVLKHGRFGPSDVALTLVRSIIILVTLGVLVVVAVVGFILIVCFSNPSSLNIH